MSDMLVANEVRVSAVPVREGYEFNPQRLTWLAKVAWWLLRKLGAVHPHWGTARSYKFVPPRENDDIREEVFGAIKGRIRDGHDIEEYAILMGQEDWHRLMRDNRDMVPLGSSSFRFAAGPFGYRGTLFNVPVHVVETVKGVALVPRVVIERD